MAKAADTTNVLSIYFETIPKNTSTDNVKQIGTMNGLGPYSVGLKPAGQVL